MKPSESTAATRVPQGKRATAPQRNAELGLFQCLVSSVSQTRRNVLTQAASDAGWDTVVCSTPDVAIGEIKRTPFHFAMVDLDDRGRTPSGARDLVQTLQHDSRRILVGVCGHEADPEEEIWVRQLGIWLYLPGLTSTTEVSLLCEQAMQLVGKQRSDQQMSSS